MRTLGSDSPNSNSSSSDNSSHNNNNNNRLQQPLLQQQYRRQIDAQEEAEELDHSSHYFERYRATSSAAVAASSGTSSTHLNMTSEEATLGTTAGSNHSRSSHHSFSQQPQPSHLTTPLIFRSYEQQQQQQQQQQQRQPAPEQRGEEEWNRGGLNNVATLGSTNTAGATSPPAAAEAQDRNSAAPDRNSADKDPPSTLWILTLYCPTSTEFTTAPHSTDYDPRNDHDAVVIRIHVTREMTHATWRQCIQHATSQYSNSIVAAPIAGLFRKRDCGYFSLEYIWETSSVKTDNNYWLFLPPNVRDAMHYSRHRRRGQQHQMPWWKISLILYGIVYVAAFVISIFQRNSIINGILSLPFDLINWIANAFSFNYLFWFHREIVESFVQGFFRNGPTWLGGWEGMPLTQVCRHISMMGDEDFWKRNMGECQRLFVVKQNAFAQVAQPIIYAILGFIIYKVAKAEYLRRRAYRPDPNMVELFQAFHVLLRQIQRALATPPHAAPA